MNLSKMLGKNTKNFKKMEVRVRFAPSPTGPLHIGSARTALFNYLFAKNNNGIFVLRIEDTDKERSELKWVQEIIDGLKWFGIQWDEGPDIDGALGPYKQSQRLDIYRKYLEKLLAENTAYYCFCPPGELEAKRQDQLSRGSAPKYDGKCRDIDLESAEKRLKNGEQAVIRFKIAGKKVKFNDMVRGDVEFDASLLGDVVIAKNLDSPLYHFAVTVDDFEMKISHVIRGEEHLSNTPRQILLQEALGFSKPIYAHLPLMLNPDRSKLSKRHGDVALSDYLKQGYLPEALINFMVLLGWNPGTEREFFSLGDLEKEFSIEKVQKAGAVFNVQKLDYINSVYIKEKTFSTLAKLCLPYLIEAKLVDKNFPVKSLEKIVKCFQGRMKKLSEISELAAFLLCDKLDYDKNLLKWKGSGEREITEALERSEKILSAEENWDEKNLEKILLAEAERFNLEKNYPAKDRGYLLWPLRVALSGRGASPGPFEIADVLGKEKTLQRISDAIKMIKMIN